MVAQALTASTPALVRIICRLFMRTPVISGPTARKRTPVSAFCDRHSIILRLTVT
ncbi:hypothetical protein MBEBAB_2084 [Brevundimonas abyssalis TAR-001]|uniref:Uncharacterized protein n=1 Tax=Brevundimonas abyssalis TAR-001 TaxID=1391729 RepID=A0A8E0NCG3_9CAUL|nr:hypothetical protein MBEBAB_2084 [Brevundimonas abyssalis TAR-001]